MAKVCQVTGRKRMVGNNVSHSKRRTKRIFALNLKTKKFWSEEEQRFITLKVSCKGMRTIEKNGRYIGKSHTTNMNVTTPMAENTRMASADMRRIVSFFPPPRHKRRR